MAPPHRPLHSCEHCRKLVLDRSEKNLAWLQYIATRLGLTIHREAWLRFHLEQKLDEDNWVAIFFDLSVEDGKFAAASGCPLFKHLFEGYNGVYTPRRLLGAKIYIPKSLPGGGPMGKAFLKFVELWVPDNVVTYEEQRESLIESKDFPPRNFDLLWSPSTSDVQRVLSSRQINMTPSSDNTFKLVASWLRECSQHHDDCGKQTGEFAPTRVLRIEKINGDIGLRLCKTDPGCVEPFAALSYCWGRDNHFTTTSDTIEHNMNGIKFESLPAAIRDAVLVTNHLGLRNLWVDALCIIQDSPEDKQYEIATMQSVYSQATITIAASRSNGVGEGFLADRNSTFFVELLSKEPDCAPGTAVIVPTCKMALEPLNTRGWALQERLLSPRFLEYGSLQTRWLCSRTFQPRCAVADSSLRFEYSEVDSSNNHLAALLSSTSSQENISTTPPDSTKSFSSWTVDENRTFGPREEALKHWDKIVTYYTHRELSEPCDRLPALSGVAARFARLLNSEYCAGLWRFRLAQDIVSWFPRGSGRVGSYTLRKRPIQYLGPSWSWAGVDFPIYLQLGFSRIHESFKILHCQLEFQNSNQNDVFGAVKSGVLTVQCRLQQVNMVKKQGCTGYDSEDYALQPSSLNQVKEEGMFTLIRIEPDYIEEELAPENEVVAISVFLMTVMDFMENRHNGIVLRNLAGEKYSRVGTFSNGWGFGSDKDWPGNQFREWVIGAEEEIIEII